jgi:hypothetical protein
MAEGVRWVVRDREGHAIYLTEERWEHITHPANHPDLLVYEEELKRTVQQGRRTQDESNPQKYRYSKAFGYLDEDSTHIVAIVLFRFREGQSRQLVPNNYIVTAYAKEIG